MKYSDIPGYCDFHEFYKSIFDSLPDNAVIAEVGVYLGHSVAYMATLAKESGKKITIHAVDTFEGSEEHQQKGVGYFYDQYFDNLCDCGVRDYIADVKSDSVFAASLYPDDHFDFVFIDAAHDYESVKKDIEAWWPKVKQCGIISGHDYCVSWPGVMKAVNEKFRSAIINKNVWKYQK